MRFRKLTGCCLQTGLQWGKCGHKETDHWEGGAGGRSRREEPDSGGSNGERGDGSRKSMEGKPHRDESNVVAQNGRKYLQNIYPIKSMDLEYIKNACN